MKYYGKRSKLSPDPQTKKAIQYLHKERPLPDKLSDNSKLKYIPVPHLPPIHTAGKPPIHTAGKPPIHTAGKPPIHTTAGKPATLTVGKPEKDSQEIRRVVRPKDQQIRQEALDRLDFIKKTEKINEQLEALQQSKKTHALPLPPIHIASKPEAQKKVPIVHTESKVVPAISSVRKPDDIKVKQSKKDYDRQTIQTVTLPELFMAERTTAVVKMAKIVSQSTPEYRVSHLEAFNGTIISFCNILNKVLAQRSSISCIEPQPNPEQVRSFYIEQAQKFLPKIMKTLNKNKVLPYVSNENLSKLNRFLTVNGNDSQTFKAEIKFINDELQRRTNLSSRDTKKPPPRLTPL